jgi:YD repeat-containing protein
MTSSGIAHVSNLAVYLRRVELHKWAVRAVALFQNAHSSQKQPRKVLSSVADSSQLVSLIPRYKIENKGSTSVSDVTTGIRSRDGRTHSFDGYRAQLLAAGEESWVENVGSIPRECLHGVHESEGFDAFLYWARFTDRDGVRWEVLYDAASRRTSWAVMQGEELPVD